MDSLAILAEIKQHTAMTADASLQLNYYDVLGANPMDQLDRIEDLFRQLAYDAETSGDHSKVPQAVEAFKVLRDPAKRHQYDQKLAQQLTLTSAQQNPQVHPGQLQATGQMLPAEQAQQPNPATAAPAQYQPAPTQPTPAQPQSFQYQPSPSQVASPQPQPFQYEQTPSQTMTPQPVQHQSTPSPEQAQVAQGQAIPQQQPSVSIPNVQPEPAAVVQAAEPPPATQPSPADGSPAGQTGAEEPPEFCAETTQRQRREILAKFYKRRRDDAKNPGIAIGGLEQKVDYSYEVLEFHLWFMQQREWLLRLESGMFTITYAGVEEHERNLIEGLIR